MFVSAKRTVVDHISLESVGCSEFLDAGLDATLLRFQTSELGIPHQIRSATMPLTERPSSAARIRAARKTSSGTDTVMFFIARTLSQSHSHTVTQSHSLISPLRDLPLIWHSTPG